MGFPGNQFPFSVGFPTWFLENQFPFSIVLGLGFPPFALVRRSYLARCSGLAATVRTSPAAGGVPYVDAGENLAGAELQICGGNIFEVVCASPQIRIFYHQ